MKVVEVSPELIAEMIDRYVDDNPGHVEGANGIILHVATNSWRHFTKKVNGH